MDSKVKINETKTRKSLTNRQKYDTIFFIANNYVY